MFISLKHFLGLEARIHRDELQNLYHRRKHHYLHHVIQAIWQLQKQMGIL